VIQEFGWAGSKLKCNTVFVTVLSWQSITRT
jgi:hypothetical protein